MKPWRRFRRQNRRLVLLTERFFQQRPWTGDDSHKQRLFETWLHGACIVYNIPQVEVMVVPDNPRLEKIGGKYARLDDGRPVILMRRWSVQTMFHEFRHHMQAHIKKLKMVGEGQEEDAIAWSTSLFNRTNPRAFRRAVRQGKMLRIKPEDLKRKVSA